MTNPAMDTSTTTTLQSFRCWVYSLEWHDLQRAVEFPLVSSAPTPTPQPRRTKRGSHATNAPPFALTSPNDAASSEWDLWHHMMALQQPRVPPVHPRAISYAPASARGKWDHCPDPVSRGTRHTGYHHTAMDPRSCPRLMRWMPHSNDRPVHPPDVQALLAMVSLPEAGTSASASRAPRAVPSQSKRATRVRRGTTPSRALDPCSYTVLARHFRQDDGTIYSVPPTVQQQQADWDLLQGAALIESTTTNTDTMWTCTWRSLDAPRRPRDHLLYLLKVASRGNFATVLSRLDNAMTAPWLDPTDRWFTLAMFLASRMEVALWHAFMRDPSHTLDHCGRTVVPRVGGPPRPLPLAPLPPPRPKARGEPSLASCNVQWGAAVVQTLRLVLQDENSRLAGRHCVLRDGMLWDLLVNHPSEQWSVPPRQGGIHGMARVACPLLEWGTTRLVWRCALHRQWHEIHSDQTRTLLWQEWQDGAAAVSDETNVANNTTATGKKKKKRRPGKRHHNPTRKDSSAVTPRVSTMAPQDSQDETSSSSTEGMETMLLVAKMRDEVPSVVSKARLGNDKNRRSHSEHTVMALSLLEDVLQGVYDKVGLVSEAAACTRVVGCDERVEYEDEEPFRVVGKGGGTASFAPKKSHKKALTAAKVVETPNTTVDDAQTLEGTKDTTPSGPVQVSSTASSESPRPNEWDSSHNHALFPSTGIDMNHAMLVHPHSQFRSVPFLSHDPSATLRRSNLQGFNSYDYDTLSPGLYIHSGSLEGATWDMPGYSEPNDWSRLRGFDREESILTEFFHSQKRDETIVASSTAASIASSDDEPDDTMLASHECTIDGTSSDEVPLLPSINDPSSSDQQPDPMVELRDPVALAVTASFSDDELCQSECDYQSPSPPSTPSPTLSPILVSLSDLSKLPRESLARLSFPSARSLSSEPTAGFPPSRYEHPTSPQMITSLSRDNLRASFSAEEPDRQRRPNVGLPVVEKLASIKPALGRPAKCRDDHDIFDKSAIRRSADALSSYRNVVVRSSACVDDHAENPPIGDIASRASPKRTASSRDSLSPGLASYKSIASCSLPKSGNHFPFDSVTAEKHRQNLTTRSETALDGQADLEWHEISRSKTDDADNHTQTRDATTTISSAASHHETDEMIMLREQRNAYRDMCLTLGAEVAKLKNLLASQRNLDVPSVNGIQSSYGYPRFPNAGPFDPVSAPPPFHIAPRARTLAAMSDAGYRGEHESLASEDDAAHRMLSYETIQGFSSGITVSVAQSDASLDHFSGHQLLQMPSGLQLQPSRDKIDTTSINAMQSRLARDIFQFLNTSTEQMNKLDGKIQTVVERMNRLVKTVWPRAQVKLYGSHVTGLCVPTSDLDFVVCLPAVHKNAVADAPGALEGRNAINETSQKLLARRLKGESWIDPRSMKLIDRTAVPVIKVATKDTRKQTLHLDISFDSPGHHGVEAAQMTASLMEELPLLRPLVVVLKQFLIERSLLEAYTGGLSSYCLSLMVARYLQEQSSGSDVGSLLMGFLDFYGNHFDPRTTGISVRHRQYFARPIYFTTARNPGRPPPLWTPPASLAGPMRRNSFSDKGSKDIVAGEPTRQFPPPFRSEYSPHLVASDVVPTAVATEPNSYDNRMPYTFDPLFVEDPLSLGNNVGRNAFRVVQVQRAFSDAHRALVAALEWDMHSTGDLQDTNDFPLLKCLLQSEDIVYDL